jgi:hypothetical protein
MIAVALSALAIYATIWDLRTSRLARHYASKSAEYEQAESTFQSHYADALANLEDLDERRRAESDQHFALTVERREFHQKAAAEIREYVAKLARKAAHYSSLKRKYEHAARYPWLSVAPDPPEPN